MRLFINEVMLVLYMILGSAIAVALASELDYAIMAGKVARKLAEISTLEEFMKMNIDPEESLEFLESLDEDLKTASDEVLQEAEAKLKLAYKERLVYCGIMTSIAVTVIIMYMFQD